MRVVIVGSAKLPQQLEKWVCRFQNRGWQVLDYPKPIAPGEFSKNYPQIYREFFQALEQAELVFVMNEDKDGKRGYIGAESFAELSYALARKLVHGQKVDICLLQAPGPDTACREEVSFWLDQGQLRIWEGEMEV